MKPLVRHSVSLVTLALPLCALGLLVAQQTVTSRFPQFENDDVKVWRSLIIPGTPLSPHHHDHGRVIVPLKGGNIDVVQQNGASEHHVWEFGKAYWLDANPPGTLHTDVNVGRSAVEVVVIELKKDK
jgi:hypothetical protein